MIRLTAWTVVLAFWLLAFVPASIWAAQRVTPSLGTTEAATNQPSRNPEFEKGWIHYFSPDYCLYLAVRNPNIEAPLVTKAISPENLAKAQEKASGKGMSDLERSVVDFADAAKKEKIIEKDLTELISLGLGQGVRPGPKQDEPRFLAVIPKTEKLCRFYEWAITRYRKEKGPDSLKDTIVEGLVGVSFPKREKSEPVIVQSDKAFLISNHREEISGAVKQAKGGKNHIGSTATYKRARSRVKPETAGFLLINPIPAWDAFKSSRALNAEQQTKLVEARKSLESLDAVLLQLSGNPKVAHVDLSVLMSPGSNAATRLAQVFKPRPIKGIDVVSDDIHAFLSLVRPPDVIAALADDTKEKVSQQLQTLKGTLQMQTGLDYDKDVAPWWGQEFCVAVSLSTNVPEVALLLESLDPKASQEAITKVVRHLSVTQNREYDERKIGNYTVQVAKPGLQPQKVPLNPTLCSMDNMVILASGSAIVESIIRSEKKLGSHPAYAAMKSIIPLDRTMLTFFLRSDLVSKVKGMRPGGPVSPREEAAQQFIDQVDAVLFDIGSSDADTIQFSVLINGK